MGFSDCF